MKYTFFVFIFIFVVYFLFANHFGDIFSRTNLDYYTLALDALFHGRVDIVPHAYPYDLSFYHEKYFLNWGPSPILFILPFYLLSGLETSDKFYTLLAGLSNTVLFFFVIKEAQKFFKITLNKFSILFLIFLFAFGSANFYLSLAGTIWHTAQIIGIFYLLISYLFLFRYLNKPTVVIFFLAVLFFNLAWTSRYGLFFSIFLFVYPLVQQYKTNNKKFLQMIGIFAITTCVFASMILSYNYLKFQNPFDTGLKSHLGAVRYQEIIKTQKFFSPEYLPFNAYYFFLNPIKLSSKSPYITVDKEGTSLFLMYPAVILLLLLYKRKDVREKKIVYFLVATSGVVLASFLLYLFYFSTGWEQVGLRYFLDITPLLYLSLIFVLPYVPRSVMAGLITYVFIVNSIAIMFFYTR